MSNPAPITLQQLFRFNRNLPHQLAAISELEADILTAGYSVAMRRDRPWFKTWSQDGKQAEPGLTPDWQPAALKIIREFEGCHLTAYPDPGTGGEPWTIGWGSTTYTSGKPVKPGDTITQAQADELLTIRVRRDALHLAKTVPTWAAMNANQKASLLSFTYNVGPNWYGGAGFTTLTARVMDAQFDRVPMALMLYVNPGSKVEAGLRIRREAECRLWFGGQLPVLEVQQAYGNPLQVPWYAQMDSTDRSQAARMCFSSSCAMLLQYLKPGTLTGANGDDQYLKRVQTFGDTIDAKAQVRALGSYGIKARFVQSAGWADIERQIAAGIPVPCGFLHRGPVTAPGGGGHWLIVVGHTQTHLVVHDPFGEADLVNGTTLGGVARFARYSRQNFGKRWMVEGPGTGWAILAER